MSNSHTADPENFDRTPTNTSIPTELTTVPPMSWHSTQSSTSHLTLSPSLNLSTSGLVVAHRKNTDFSIAPSLLSSSTNSLPSTPPTPFTPSSLYFMSNLKSSPPHLPSRYGNHRAGSFSRDENREETYNVQYNNSPHIPARVRGMYPKIIKEQIKEDIQTVTCRNLAKDARQQNDAMVYLDGPRIYTCGECRTHLTSHDEIISKSFHGRNGRAYLFDQCVNITVGPPEDRRLITGLHSVCDIFCKRCETLIGWSYTKAYEPSQKYKEGKFIIEKIHLHMEESDCYAVDLPAGEKRDKWKIRSMSWSDDGSIASRRKRLDNEEESMVYEYRPRARTASSMSSYASNVA